VAGFDAALKKLVLDPLHMTRTRGSRSKAEEQGSDHARHHDKPQLGTGTSVVHDDRRIVPTQYGTENYEVYDGAGGVSSAIVDLARLCAMFSCRIGNPLFTTTILDHILGAAVDACAAGTDKGYHGMDVAQFSNETEHRVFLAKGGLLTGVRAGFKGTTGERFVVVAYNGESVPDLGIDIKEEVDKVAATVNWGSGDLFPLFGMPSIGIISSRRPRIRPALRSARATSDDTPAV
jgi:hypothetical protein